MLMPEGTMRINPHGCQGEIFLFLYHTLKENIKTVLKQKHPKEIVSCDCADKISFSAGVLKCRDGTGMEVILCAQRQHIRQRIFILEEHWIMNFPMEMR